MPVLCTAWPTVTIVATGVSALLLVAYWNNELVFGVAIDAALVAAALPPDRVEKLVA